MTQEQEGQNMFHLSPEDTVTSRLRYWSVTSPETFAFVYVTPDGERFGYSRKELFSLSCRAASWLRHRGVGRQDVVLCLVPTSPEQTFVSLGASVLGATTICTVTQYQDASDILPVMNLGDVTAIVLDQTDEQVITALRNYIPNICPGSVTSKVIPSLRTIIFCNRFPKEAELSFLDLISTEEEAEVIDVSPEDVAMATIFATSGTSGQSKLVPSTHRHVLAMGLDFVGKCSIQIGDVSYNPSSFGWISGYPSVFCVCGQTRVAPYVKGSRAKDEEKFLWDLWKKENVTHVLATSPAVFMKLLACRDLLQSEDTWRVPCVIFGGIVFKKDYARILGSLTSSVLVAYACTEAGLITCKIYTEHDEVEDFNCGKPVIRRMVKVVDENLQEVPLNTKGDILIKHNGCFLGYLKQPAITADATPEEGWFRPEDLGYVSNEGDLFVQGRQSEVICIGSFKLHPQLLETRLLECPGVHDVAVIPVPDNDFNNRPCVCVLQDPRPEAERVVPEDVLRMCAEYFQGSFLQVNKQGEAAIPQVCLVFDKFPVNPNGKLQRKALRVMALQRLKMQNE